jgi:hypothetical protein
MEGGDIRTEGFIVGDISTVVSMGVAGDFMEVGDFTGEAVYMAVAGLGAVSMVVGVAGVGMGDKRCKWGDYL